jgi:hypothetical protein
MENAQDQMAPQKYKKPKKQKHNYTSELELKSLLIRIKNSREDMGTERDNTKINKYIKWHTAINTKKYAVADKNKMKSKLLKAKIKLKIVALSEGTRSDIASYERFGAIILLMIKNILKSPQYSSYTFKDDFYSDAVYKILKYLHNFKHKMISERSGVTVNAFAYISQIIYHSIWFIINSKKKDLMNLRKQIAMEYLNHDVNIKSSDLHVWDDRGPDPDKIAEDEITVTITIDTVDVDLVNEVQKLQNEIRGVERLNLYYPANYVISLDEYNRLRPVLNGNISIMRSEPPSLLPNLIGN